MSKEQIEDVKQEKEGEDENDENDEEDEGEEEEEEDEKEETGDQDETSPGDKDTKKHIKKERKHKVKKEVKGEVKKEEGQDEKEDETAQEDPNAVFKPKLYDFELENYNKLKTMLYQNTRVDNLEIRCPEFHVLLDHTIAFVWLFYYDGTNWNKFTIPQIEWTLKFIGGIASDKGGTFEDMERIKNHLEQLLFLRYTLTDIAVLDEKPPVEDIGKFGTIDCPERTLTCTPVPESLKELLSKAPEMIECLSIARDKSQLGIDQTTADLEASHASVMKNAYEKLNNFERKHLSRITEEIDLFEMIKQVKLDLGYKNGNVNADDITALKRRIEELEQKLIVKKEEVPS